MQPKTLHVFVSSTWKDLNPERKAVEIALQRMRETKFLGMEYFGSRDEDTRQASLDEVDRCQIYIGIFGKRYGSGITEEEYRRAREKGLKCFIYFKDESTIKPEELETDPENMVKLENLKKELLRLNSGHTIGPEFKNPDDLAAKITADLHRWIMDLFIYGISSLTTDYSVRIRNFITEYLGTPEQPVPFGGRDSDLRNLNAWLDDREAPHYMLLAAPAGRGKSALLVNWSQQLLTRNDLAVVFIPVSIRFRTNLASVVFAASAARLAALHGEDPPDPNASAEVLRGMTADYLSRPLPGGRLLLIILDGVDEAADWEAGADLFSLTPPEGLRVIVSARYLAGDTDATNWLRRLGWDRPGSAQSPELSPLTREGVADVLWRMGVPLDRLSERVDIVAELYRLSEGDPLLVRLYVNDLWDRREAATRLKPEDLLDLSPGLEGYFDRWWDEQRQLWDRDAPLREPEVRELLNLFACSLGPLSRDDILNLASHEVELNTWTLESALSPLARFIIGDGDHQGYAFGHPRLGAYFYDKLTERERRSIESRFFIWGEDTLKALNERKLAPDGASPYIVQYYGAHLERSGSDAETLLSLVSEGWLRAWETLEGAFSGFLNDVGRAWNAAEKADKELIDGGGKAAFLGDMIRCALCFASVSSLSSKIPPILLVTLVKNSIWNPIQGLAYAEKMTESTHRSEALALLMPHLPRNMRWNALKESLKSLCMIQDKSQFIDVLEKLAPIMPEEFLRDALEFIRHNSDERYKADILRKIALHLSEKHLLEMSLEIIQEINDEKCRSDVMVELIPYLPENLLNITWEEAQKISDDSCRVGVLVRLAPYFKSRMSEIFEKVIKETSKIKDDWDRLSILTRLTPYLSETQIENAAAELENIMEKYRCSSNITASTPRKMENMHEALMTISDYFSASISLENALVEMSVRMAELGKEEYALSKLGEIYEDSLIKLLVRIMPLISEEGLKSVLDYVQKIKRSDVRTEALAKLALQLPKPLKESALEGTLISFRALQDEYLQAKKELKDLLNNKPETLKGHIKETLSKEEWIIEDRWHRVQSDLMLATQILEEGLSKLAPIIAELGFPNEARIAVRKIDSKYEQADVFAKMLPYVPELLKDEILNESLETATEIEAEGLLVDILAELASYMQKTTMDSILIIAQCINDETYKKELLDAFAPHLPNEKLYIALNIARSIRDESDRSETLKIIGDYLLKKYESMETLRNESVSSLTEKMESKAQKETLISAIEIQYPRHRAETLVSLAPKLSDPLIYEALKEAIQAVREIRVRDVWTMPVDENDKQRVLNEIAKIVPEELLDEALVAVREIINEAVRANTLKKFFPRIMEFDRPEIALREIRTISDIECRSIALIPLMPHLPNRMLGEVLDLINKSSIKDDDSMIKDRLTLIESFSMLELAFLILQGLQYEYDRSRALVELAPYLPEPLLGKALVEARKIQNKYDRINALDKLAFHLAEISLAGLYPLWFETLRGQSKQTRPDLLSDLGTLAPVIAALGGPEALKDTAQAIEDVVHWWP